MPIQLSGASNPRYDLYISHESENNEAVARPLAEALVAQGLKVWCDEKELLIGECMAGNIDERIRASRAAVTVLSRAYIENKWKLHELNTLVYLAMSTGRKIYPVWHNITAGELEPYALFFSVVAGLSTDEHCIESIANEISRAVSHDVA